MMFEEEEYTTASANHAVKGLIRRKAQWRIKHVTCRLHPSRSHTRSHLTLPSVHYEVKAIQVKHHQEAFKKLSRERRMERCWKLDSYAL